MSLILEALRKLERDRPRDERPAGVVLLAPRAWPERRTEHGRRRALKIAMLLLAPAAVVATIWFLWPRPAVQAPAVAPPPAAPGPAARTADIEATPTPPAEPSPPGLTPVAAPREAAPRLATPAPPTPAPPTRPSPAPAHPAFVLTAIGERDGHPVAMLNDRLVREGDAIGGTRVVRIEEAQVELELADGRHLTVGF